MKKKISLAGCMVCFLLSATAQQVPIEIMGGTNNHRYQHNFAHLADSSRLGFFNTSSLQIYPAKHRPDEVMSQSYLTWQLVANVKLAAGVFYASGPGFRPSVALQWHKKWPCLLLVVVQRMDVWRSPSVEVMSFAEYRPWLSEKVKLYSRIQAMENFSGTVHNRSYQHARLGLDISNFQFGIATNIDAYGKEMSYQPNYGFFIRKELF